MYSSSFFKEEYIKLSSKYTTYNKIYSRLLRVIKKDYTISTKNLIL